MRAIVMLLVLMMLGAAFAEEVPKPVDKAAEAAVYRIGELEREWPGHQELIDARNRAWLGPLEAELRISSRLDLHLEAELQRVAGLERHRNLKTVWFILQT